MPRWFPTILTVVLLAVAILGQEVPEECPKLDVIGPGGVTYPGERMTFVLQYASADVSPTQISWKLDVGKIVSGQGTRAIDVVSEVEASTVTATVTISDLPDGCANTASEKGGVMQRFPLEKSDEWGELPNDDQIGRLDLFFAELSNSPHHKGVIFIYTKNKAVERRRLRLVLDHARFRKFDRSVLMFCLEKADQNSTKVYRIPPERMSEILEWGCKPIPGALLR